MSALAARARPLVLAATMVAGAGCSTRAVVAQEAGAAPDRGTEVTPTTGRWGCLHGAPVECASLWLIELQASTPLVQPSYGAGDPTFPYRREAADNQYEWNLGHLATVGADWGFGGTVTLGSGADDVFTGLRARARRWVGEAVSVELEVGLARSNGNHHWPGDQTGWSTGVRFNVLDFGSAFVRHDVYDLSARDAFPGLPATPITGRQNIVRGGVALGGGAAVAGTGAVVVAYTVLLALFFAGGGGS